MPPFNEKFTNIEVSLKSMEEDIEELKKRPAVPIDSGNSNFDISMVWLDPKWKDLTKRVELIDRRNAEQDERLTDNEQRLQRLESMITDPLERIKALEERSDAILTELNNKANVRDMFNELMKKADIDALKALESSLIKLNQLINDLVNRFADRVENDKAHKLLQKNLKNLYELFMSLKGTGNEDDPMFTTKGL